MKISCFATNGNSYGNYVSTISDLNVNRCVLCCGGQRLLLAMFQKVFAGAVLNNLFGVLLHQLSEVLSVHILTEKISLERE